MKTSLLCLVLFINLMISKAQVGVKFYAGAGFPELLNLGAGCAFRDRLQVNFNYGTLPNGFESISILNAGCSWFIGDSSSLSKKRRYYSKVLWTTVLDETDKIFYRFNIASIRLGKEFYYSKKSGLFLEGGFAYQLSKYYMTKDPKYIPGDDFFYRIRYFLSFNVGYFHRISN